jgi:GT2 family glycosyltransferase
MVKKINENKIQNKMNQETKLIIGIPTINCADLLNEALIKYFEDFKNTEIFIVDNGNQEIVTREKQFVIYRPESNLNVSGSWNLIMDYANRVGATHVLMLNDDVYLGKEEQEINSLIELNNHIGFFNSYYYWSSFILNVKEYNRIGIFDQQHFPNYFNDNDFFYRMQLLETKMSFTHTLDPVVQRNSMTIAKDPSLNSRFMEYRQNYINKWGGLPTQETYTTPFNQ